MNVNQNCPCGTGDTYATCCQPIVQGMKKAITATQLMQSRYSAFVLKEADHILRSWHESSRPRSLNFDAHPVTWLGLEIHASKAGQATDDDGSVEFTSSYLEHGQLCRLRETSDFVKENGEWYYKRGECHVTKEKIERNRACPCGSGKKFKRCCLHLT